MSFTHDSDSLDLIKKNNEYLIKIYFNDTRWIKWPTVWVSTGSKSSSVDPIFKNPSEASDLSNSRLLPLFEKILDALINTELVMYLTSDCILSDKQCGSHFSWPTVDILTIIPESF